MASLNHAQSGRAEAVHSSERHSEASTSYRTKLPDKKTFIATLSGGAFIVGLTGATIYGLRKARLQALKEAKELAEATAAGTLQHGSLASSTAAKPTVPVASRATREAEQRSEVAQEAEGSTSAMALFRQMNAAILSPSKRSSVGAGSAPTSVFDDETGALPSVLRRRKVATTPSAPNPTPSTSNIPSGSHIAAAAAAASSPSSATATMPHPNDPKIDYSEMDSTLDFLGLSTPVPAEEQRRMQELESNAHTDTPRRFFDSPVGLSLKAFFIATSIVTFSTYATVETTKYALGVETMDEFVVAMTKLIPSRQRGEESLSGAAPHMRVQRGDDEGLTGAGAKGGAAAEPKSVDQALTDLSNASSFEEWVSTLKTQLDTERDFEVSRRFGNVDTQAANDSISATRSYTAHSPLEADLDSSRSFFRSVLAISPVLPSTAFGLGLVSGALTSGKRAGLVFMAENAHRLPDTVQGWYFYSKTKNYKVLLGAAKGGLRQGVRLGLWTTGFCFAERIAELTRTSLQTQWATPRVVGHWTDGALAGVATAAAGTALYRLPRASAVRVLQLGLLAGASTGAIRDLQERLVRDEIGGVASHT